MEPIQAYESGVELGVEAFTERYRNPFLIHAGGPLRSVAANQTRAFTVDRLVLEPEKPQAMNPSRDMKVVEIAAKNPAERTITIGVSTSCDVVINDASLSKQHAWFDRATDGWRIWDNDSIAGTQVNRVLVKPGRPHMLKTGDLVSLGYVDLTFLSPTAFHHLIRSIFVPSAL